jgi:hypothetical protein
MSKSTLGSGGDGALVFYRCRTVLVFSKSIKPISVVTVVTVAELWKLPLIAPGSALHLSILSRLLAEQSQLLFKKVFFSLVFSV